MKGCDETKVVKRVMLDTRAEVLGVCLHVLLTFSSPHLKWGSPVTT